MRTLTPEYLYPGQVFDEIASLATVIPQYPALAYSLSNIPGSRDTINTAARAIMESGLDPYGE